MQKRRFGLTCAAVFVVGVLSVGAFAQGAAQPGGGRQGRGQGRGQGGFFGQQGSLATIPASVLADQLKLTAAQQTKISAIQDKLKADTKDLMPQAGSPAPDRATMQANRQKIGELNKQANQDIETVLTTDQKAKAPDVVKSLNGLSMIGIRPGVLSDLKLTSDQMKKLSTIADDSQKQMQASMEAMRNLSQEERQQKGQEMMQAMTKMREDNQAKAMAVLTDSQKATLDKYNKEHPLPTFGRRPGAGA